MEGWSIAAVLPSVAEEVQVGGVAKDAVPLLTGDLLEDTQIGETGFRYDTLR